MHCNKNGCWSIKFCPLVPAWVSTIHKFQGFGAEFGNTDQFKYLILDPGPTSWEQNCSGALYVALSQAKPMGDFWSDTDNPSDSAIYLQGNGMCEDRIRDGALKNGNRPGGVKVNCVLIDKREQWVIHLTIREQNTTKNNTPWHSLNNSRQEDSPNFKLTMKSWIWSHSLTNHGFSSREPINTEYKTTFLEHHNLSKLRNEHEALEHYFNDKDSGRPSEDGFSSRETTNTEGSMFKKQINLCTLHKFSIPRTITQRSDCT